MCDERKPTTEPTSPARAAQRRATMQVSLKLLRDALRLPGNVEVLEVTGTAGGRPVTLVLVGHGLPKEAAQKEIRVGVRHKTTGVCMPDGTVEQMVTFDGWEVLER